MLYHYLASDKQGVHSEGEYEAADLGGVLSYLARSNLQPISVKPVEKKDDIKALFKSGNISVTDKIFLMRYLALMLRVGTDLLSAVNILLSDFEKPAVREFLMEVRSNLTRGQAFYQAFAARPKMWSLVTVNLIKAAEASGNLQSTLEDLTVQLEKDAALMRKIKSAFIYPIILLITSLVIFLFLSLFALPKIAKVFSDTGIKPPAFSRIVFAVGLFAADHAVAIVSTIILGSFGAIWFLTKTLVGRKFISRAFERTPIVKRVVADLAVQRFASTYASLLKAGLPIVETTRITADVVGTEHFRVALLRVADEGLSKGLTVGEAFRRETIFPKVVTNLIAISEKAGHMEEVLRTVADFYAGNVDDSIKTLVAFLEPMLLLGMGGLVALIAMSIIIPIYQLTSTF
jgi:type IV pilus assembly protein PilC